MELQGGCHCGDLRYSVQGEPAHVALCHCSDCRKSSGAPMVAWAAYQAEDFSLTSGTPSVYTSPSGSVRHFCPKCGSGLYFINEAALPGLIDIQVATLDSPEKLPPQAHIQVAERIDWAADMNALPQFDRYPGG